MTAAPALIKIIKYKLIVSGGENAGQSFFFDKSIVLIGRGPENDIVFANDPKMSRTHAEIRQQGGHIIIRNVSQKNLILVNGEKVEEKTLTGNAMIQIGETTLQFHAELEPSLEPAKPAMPQTPARTNSQPPPVSRKQDFYQPQSYSPPQPPPSSRPQRASAIRSSGNSSRVRFYIIIAAVGALIYWFVASSSSAKKAETHLRTEGDVARAIEDSAHVVQELRKQQETAGQDSLQYKAAQEHYIKGFRDYRQGQYARAMQSFQAALSFYPNHELARKYLLQAQRKFEAQIDFNLAQGRKYYQKQNYKMCQSAFATVMMMVKDSAKLKYKEAKQIYDECSLRVEGGY